MELTIHDKINHIVINKIIMRLRYLIRHHKDMIRALMCVERIMWRLHVLG